MRALRLALAAYVVAAIPLLGNAPAHAALSGPCSASGTLTGKTYNPKSVNKVTIARKGDVHWNGSLSGSGTRPIAGHVQIKMPFGEITLGSWGRRSDLHANRGVYHYDLPSVLEGFDIPVTGAHTERGVVCAGAVVVRFEGDGGFANPAVIGTFVLTILSGIGLVVAFRPKVV